MRRLTSFGQLLRRRLYGLLVSHTTGQGLVEYGLILVLIAVVCVGILSLTGQTVSALWYQRVIDSLDDILS
jgi:Flp pilus assembly pilin Flp